MQNNIFYRMLSQIFNGWSGIDDGCFQFTKFMVNKSLICKFNYCNHPNHPFPLLPITDLDMNAAAFLNS